MKISADMGHGWGKFFDGSKKIIEETLLGEAQQTTMESNGHKQIATDEGRWFVGSTARTQSIAKIRGQDETWAFSPEYRALMLYGISEYASPETDRIVIDLVSGLPVVDYKRNREALTETLVKTHKAARPHKRNLTIEVRKVAWLPQGFAPARTFIQPGRKVATLDLGSRNVGYTTFVYKELIEPQTDSRENGAMPILADISKKIEEKTKRKLHQVEIVDVIKTRTVHAFGEPVNVSEIIDYYLNIYYRSIKTVISEVWGNTADVDKFVVFGGGALLIGDRITKDYPQAVILDDPQWANCYAQYEYGRRRL